MNRSQKLMNMLVEETQVSEALGKMKELMSELPPEEIPQVMACLDQKMEAIQDPENKDEPDLDDKEENTKLFKDARQFMRKGSSMMENVVYKMALAKKKK